MTTDTEKPIDLELPNKWLWDIIDEFIYQVSGGGGGETGTIMSSAAD